MRLIMGILGSCHFLDFCLMASTRVCLSRSGYIRDVMYLTAICSPVRQKSRSCHPKIPKIALPILIERIFLLPSRRYPARVA